MKKRVCPTIGFLAFSTGLLFGQVGTEGYQCFPTCSETDARMLSLGGTALNTVAGFEIEIQISIPPGSSSFEIGIFDGDTGKDDAGVLTNGNPTLGTWDQGTDELTYTLVADPAGDGSGTTVVAEWFGNSDNFDAVSPPFPLASWTASALKMPNNAWWDVVVETQSLAQADPGAPFIYALRITNAAPSVVVSSSFKLRTTGAMLVRSPEKAWGVQAAVRVAGGPTARIVYPQWNGLFTLPSPDFFLNTFTTYDGTFTFNFEVPPNQTEVQIFDGDFDFGSTRNALGVVQPGSPSGVVLEPCLDGDDANSSGVPAFALLANPEGSSGLSGNPPDDNSFDLFRRTPCVRYELVDPNGVVYRNNNPSGNFEWERFVVTSLPAGPGDADYSTTFAADDLTLVAPGFLPAGRWQLILRGLDTANTVFLNGPDIAGVVSASIGDRVWLDRNADGIQDDPMDEPGINGVLVSLYRDDGDGIFNPNPNPGMAFGFDTLVDTQITSGDGDYLFSPLGGGNYFVAVASGNFAPGGSLEGYLATFDFDGGTGAPDDQTSVPLSESQTFLLADFGYKAGSIGDLVWLDSNGDGLFQPLAGELPISGVNLDLTGQATGTRDTINGLYLFDDLRGGFYTVIVDSSNFNSGGALFGLVQTFDFDGFLDNRTGYGLAAGEDFELADFGYRPQFAPGTGTPGYWKNHPEAWPVDFIEIGGIVYSKATAIDFLLDKKNDESVADKTISMFSHLVAAKLNVGVGNDWSCTGTAIPDADAWMAVYPLGSQVDGNSDAWKVGQAIKNTLDRYNNGKLSCAPPRD